jgi:hypothetical protein
MLAYHLVRLGILAVIIKLIFFFLGAARIYFVSLCHTILTYNIFLHSFCRIHQVLLGDVGTGKSSLVLRFVKGQFVEFQVSLPSSSARMLMYLCVLVVLN